MYVKGHFFRISVLVILYMLSYTKWVNAIKWEFLADEFTLFILNRRNYSNTSFSGKQP